MESTQREEIKNVFIDGGFAMNTHGGSSANMSRVSKWGSSVLIATAAAVTLFSAAASAADRHENEGDRATQAGNGPGPAANGAGPGCNVIPPEASIGTRADISEFPPPDSLTDPELAGPVQLLRSGKFDIPIERLTGVEVPAGSPRGTITLPLFKGAVKTPSGLKPAWYIILDAGDQAEADRLGVNFSRKLRNAGDAARPATRRADGTFLFESGIVYDAPIIAAAVENAAINFPNGDPDYALVHDQVIAIDPTHGTVTLALINGFSFGKPVLYISTDSSDPGVSAIEANTFAPRMRRLEVAIDDIARSAVERIFIATNGPSEGGCNNPQRQGLSATLLDGHRPNNTFGGIPTIATDYSPVWDANLYEWTKDSIEKGYRGLLTEEFRILKLARDGYITGPNGAPFGSAGPVIVCGVAARLN